MKIIVNISHLNNPQTGIEHYTLELLKRLMVSPEVEDLVGFDTIKFYSKEEIKARLATNALVAISENASKYKVKHLLKQIPGARRLYHLLWRRMHQQRLNDYAQKGYLYWEPNYITQPYLGKSFPVVHDLSVLQCPQYHLADKVKWFSENLPKSIQSANRIQTISKYSQQQIAQTFQIPKNQIDIIPPGVDDIFYPRAEAQATKVLSKYGIQYKAYLLSVSTIEPRKNLKGLFAAWSQLSETLKAQYPLVLVGKKGWLHEDFGQTIAPYIQKGQVILTGHIPTEDLPHLYSGAKVFAYLSFYEGYGMPVAEAICCGTWVLASNATSIPEAGQQYAEYVSPNHTEEITQKLTTLLQTQSVPPLPNRDNYSWEHATDRLIQSFKKGEE